MKTCGQVPKATAGYPQAPKKASDGLHRMPILGFFGSVDNPLPQERVGLYRPLSL